MMWEDLAAANKKIRELEAVLEFANRLGADAKVRMERAEAERDALMARVTELKRYIWNNTRGWPVEQDDSNTEDLGLSEKQKAELDREREAKA
jgi:hypothetical protein